MQAHYADALFAQSRDLTFAQSDSLQRRIDRAHSSLPSAAKALAHLRWLALPVVLARVGVTATPPRPELGQA